MSICINPMAVVVNTGKDLACLIPNVEMSPLEFFKTPFCNSIFISRTTAEEIETESTKLKCSKAAGLLVYRSLFSKFWKLFYPRL